MRRILKQLWKLLETWPSSLAACWVCCRSYAVRVTGPGKVAGKYERMGAHAGMPLYQGAFMCLLGPTAATAWRCLEHFWEESLRMQHDAAAPGLTFHQCALSSDFIRTGCSFASFGRESRELLCHAAKLILHNHLPVALHIEESHSRYMQVLCYYALPIPWQKFSITLKA